MADITMCQNEDCPSKEKCLRYMAEASKNQSYAYLEVAEGKDKCEYFMEIKNEYESIYGM